MSFLNNNKQTNKQTCKTHWTKSDFTLLQCSFKYVLTNFTSLLGIQKSVRMPYNASLLPRARNRLATGVYHKLVPEHFLRNMLFPIP
jgi:hypothetical protein